MWSDDVRPIGRGPGPAVVIRRVLSRVLALVLAVAATVVVVSTTVVVTPAQSLPNGLALTPPMGWNSWYAFRCEGINETAVKRQIDVLVSSGMRDLGYQYVNLDDCWNTRNPVTKLIEPDPTRFPSGMKAFGDYIHARGLKFGIYTDAGTATCAIRPGGLGYETQDARTYASWGVDFVKVDFCNTDPRNGTVEQHYIRWRDAIAASGRPMVFSICSWGAGDPHNWGPRTGNMWRTTGDIFAHWGFVTHAIDKNSSNAVAAGPGGWNDPDVLQVGNPPIPNDPWNPGLSDTEQRAMYSMHALAAAPLLAGNDLTKMSAAARETLTNPEVIAIDQDRRGYQGVKVAEPYYLHQVWSKPLEGTGQRAVALFNRGEGPATIAARWRDVGLMPGTATVRDLWAHADRGVFTDEFSATVPAHGVVLVRITGVEPPAPTTTSYVSELTPFAPGNGYGVVERDRSVGDLGTGDGQPITLDGVTYGKGLGAHANSDIGVRLDGNCDRFTADVGVDDEVGDQGSVIFQVWADGTKLWDSGLMTGSSGTKKVDVDLNRRQSIRLVVSDAVTYDFYGYGSGDNGWDHADWADAKVTCGLPHAGMTATATSEQSNHEARKAIDDDRQSMWHNRYATSTPLPQALTLALDAPRTLTALRYTPRQDASANGVVTAYTVLASTDGTTFTEVAAGSWVNDRTEKRIALDLTGTVAVRLVATAGVGGFAAAAEVSLEGNKQTAG